MRRLDCVRSALVLVGLIGPPTVGSSQAQTFELEPSVTSSTLGQGERTLELVVSCEDDSGIIPNCNLRVTHRAIALTGGHLHDDAARPKGRFSPDMVNTGPTGRAKVIYTAPEPAGSIEVTLSGTTAEGVEVIPAVSTILVRIRVLVALAASGPGYSTTVSTLYGSNNRSGTDVTLARLTQIVADFRARLQAQNVPDADIPTIVDVDMRVSNIRRDYRDELDAVILVAGFIFPVGGESPSDPAATHWHLRRR